MDEAPGAKRPRKAASKATEAVMQGPKARAPALAYLGRVCRIREVTSAEHKWEAYRVLAYKGRDKQTIELGHALADDEQVVRSIELRDYSLQVLTEIGWGPEPVDGEVADGADPETFVPLLLFTAAGRAEPEARGRLLAHSPHSDKQSQRVTSGRPAQSLPGLASHRAWCGCGVRGCPRRGVPLFSQVRVDEQGGAPPSSDAHVEAPTALGAQEGSGGHAQALASAARARA